MRESTPEDRFRPRRLGLRAAGAVFCAAIAVAAPPSPAGAQSSEIDAFMEQVLSRRVRNWEDLYRYTVRDRESVEVRGPLGQPIESFRAEYIWYVRDGYMVRSPQKRNGVAVGDEERERFEQRFLERLKREEKEREEKATAQEERAPGEPREGSEEGNALERENFLGFPFEPGNYLLAGRETLDGRDLLKIEYYPEKLFDERTGDPDADEEESDSEGDAEEAEFIRGLQKTSRVTMWVLPEEHQIVRMTFDNVGLDFLPGRWFVQVGDISATLEMEKLEAEGVWLPRRITAHGEVTVAAGSYEALYSLEYFDYRKSEVQAKVRYALPEQEQQP
jgi:hypothetical protein